VRALENAFGELNKYQKKAVLASRSTVVLAGPGSGKTATLVVKAAYLLAERIQPPRGLACITFNNEAAGEFRKRLALLGVNPGERVFLGTLHSFCLNCVLRPLGGLQANTATPDLVVSEEERAKILRDAADEVQEGLRPYDLESTITRLRSRIACNEDISGFADSDLQILKKYSATLRSRNLIDFDGMVLNCLALLQSKPWIAEILAAKFPWILIDEYQDLGGPLHKIVEILASKGSICIFAVGDPDQSIYDFAGADPKYISELTERTDFKTVRLKFNYRSGKRLIAASQAALAPSEPRDFRPNPESKNEGEVLFIEGNGLVEDHPKAIVGQALPELLARGFEYGDIAIFYKRRGSFLSSLENDLTKAGVPFVKEKHENYPRTRITRWLQQFLQLSLGYAGLNDLEVDFSLLAEIYHAILLEGKLAGQSASIEERVDFLRALQSHANPDERLKEFIGAIEDQLHIRMALGRTVDIFGDLNALGVLVKGTSAGGPMEEYTVRDFALEGRAEGKITLTTHHSSKGRQFGAVVIPELVEQVFPAAAWVPEKLRQERRLFYVAFTRAKRTVILVYGNSYRKRNGAVVESGVSRFVREIHLRLKESP
jgi:DNA helicase II / ATP-dependent DNA helicase PcrA